MNLVAALLIAVIIYVLQKRLYAVWWNRNLDVTIAFTNTCIREGEKSVLTERICNEKFLPLPVFHVKFSTSCALVFDDRDNTAVTDSYYRNDAFSVLGYRRITRNLSFRADKRGLYDISTLQTTARDFFMTTNFASSRKSDVWLYVLPMRADIPALAAFCAGLLGEMEVQRNLTEDPYTFLGIREYRSGDMMRKINWKATAKRSELMVNQYGFTSRQHVRILLNLETNIMVRTEYLREMSIRIAGTAAEFFLKRQVPVAIISNGMDVLTHACERVEAGVSPEHMSTIDRYLARIGENAGIDRFLSILDEELQRADPSVTYLVISPYYKEDLLVKLDYMRNRRVPVQMLVPYYDIQDTDGFRPYMHGMEVKWNET